MKILIISDRYPPFYSGGYEINCEVTVKGLEKRGHQCVVLTSNYGLDKQVKEGNILRILYSLVPDSGKSLSKRGNHLHNSFLGHRNYNLTLKVIKDVKPDVAFIWRMGHVSVFPLNAVHEQGIPAVYELGDYWLLEYKRDYILEVSRLKRFYRSVLFGGNKFHRFDFSNIIAISAALKRHYVENGFESENITVIPRGIPENFLIEEASARDNEKCGAFKLLYAGRLLAEKGVHIAVQSIDYIVHKVGCKNIHLDIIGSGRNDYLMELNSIIESTTLQQYVQIKELIPRLKLLELYADYDALLFPSIWEEPFGMTIIEAMARGLPVIATWAGAAPEIINDSENGLLVAPQDPVQLGEAIMKLMNTPCLAAEIQTAGLRTIREKFFLDFINDQIESYLLGVTGEYNHVHATPLTQHKSTIRN